MQFRYFLQPGFQNLREIELIEAAKMVIDTCLQVKPGENVAIVTDTMQSVRITEALAMAVNLAGAEYTILIIRPRKSMYGPLEVTEPPKPVAGALKQADAALLIATTGLIWTNAVRQALKNGLRVLTGPGISEDNFARCCNIDYGEVGRITRRVQSFFTKGKKVELTSPQGTKLALEIGYQPLFERDGIVSNPGEFDFLPTGFAVAGIKERTANGILVIDGAFSRIGVLREPIILTIENGRIVETKGGFEKREFHTLMDMFGDPNMYNLASFATGTNPNAKFVGQPNEDERVIGMMTFLFGDNYNNFKGKNRACMILVATLTTPQLVIDGKVLLENGTLKV